MRTHSKHRQTRVPPATSISRGMAAIEARGLTKRYGSRDAVSALSFSVPVGSVCGFVGPNGAGKSTTIRMLLGLVAPTSGTATVMGHPLKEPETFLPLVGAMIEGPAFYPWMSGRMNLVVLAKLSGVSGQRVDHCLDLVDMRSRAGDPYRAYSLGMKQRLGIAAALLGEPRLLILDEPTNGLDPAGIADVRELIRLLATTGVTVFVSSHLLAEVEAVADHLVMIRDGRTVFTGPVRDLLAAQVGHLRAVTDPPSRPALLAAVAGLGLAAVVDADGAVLVSALPHDAGRVNTAAMRAGAVLNELVAVRPTLEDTFFALTSVATSPPDGARPLLEQAVAL